jgi:DNA polymerase III epsilon subunit-like protein
MIELFFDFETTGLVNRDEDLDHPSQPHIMEMAFVKRVDGEEIASMTTLVECEVDPHPKALEVHGITKEMTKYSMTPEGALILLSGTVVGVDRIISHNITFELQMLGIAARRYLDGTSETVVPKDLRYCTMREAQSHFGKWPRLDFALQRVATPEQIQAIGRMHRAMADTRACILIYDWMQAQDKEALAKTAS